MSTLIETPGYDLKKKRRIAPDLPGVPPGHHSGQDVDEVEGPVIETEHDYCVLIIIKYMFLLKCCAFLSKKLGLKRHNPSGFFIHFQKLLK